MEGLLALLALVHACFAVVDHVALQVLAVAGDVLADGALVGLPLAVHPQVLLDVALVAAAVVAQAAAVRPLGAGDELHQVTPGDGCIAGVLALGVVL